MIGKIAVAREDFNYFAASLVNPNDKPGSGHVRPGVRDNGRDIEGKYKARIQGLDGDRSETLFVQVTSSFEENIDSLAVDSVRNASQSSLRRRRNTVFGGWLKDIVPPCAWLLLCRDSESSHLSSMYQVSSHTK